MGYPVYDTEVLQADSSEFAFFVYALRRLHDTYDHRIVKTALPVCSAVLNHYTGELVVGSVTTSESSLLVVFVFFVGQLDCM